MRQKLIFYVIRRSLYIDEIYNRGLELWKANSEYCDCYHKPPEGYNHIQVCNVRHDQMVWMIAQPAIAKEKFRKYLDLKYKQ
jgi:hypothetical protein